jgi:hypothetical protein
MQDKIKYIDIKEFIERRDTSKRLTGSSSTRWDWL